MIAAAGYPATDDGRDAAQLASERSSAAPGVIELIDGSYAGKADDTIDDTGRVHCWAWVPSGLVEIARDDHGMWAVQS